MPVQAKSSDAVCFTVTDFFERIRSTTWPVLALAAGAYCGTILFVNTVLFQGVVSDALGRLYRFTEFFVNSSLIGGLVELAVFCTIVFGLGRLRPSDVGWTVSAACWGLLVTLAFWIAMQGVLSIVAAITGNFLLHDAWNRPGSVIAISGGLMGQLFGNALLEETGCRGFFLPQFYLKAAGPLSPKPALMIAVLGSSLLFAAAHIPNRLWVGDLAGIDLLIDQIGLVVVGLIFATVYLVTRNLFIAIGLHALLNEPVPIVLADAITVYAVWFGLTVLVVITWPFLQRHITRKIGGVDKSGK
jgi:hypothetical protein